MQLDWSRQPINPIGNRETGMEQSKAVMLWPYHLCVNNFLITLNTFISTCVCLYPQQSVMVKLCPAASTMMSFLLQRTQSTDVSSCTCMPLYTVEVLLGVKYKHIPSE